LVNLFVAIVFVANKSERLTTSVLGKAWQFLEIRGVAYVTTQGLTTQDLNWLISVASHFLCELPTHGTFCSQLLLFCTCVPVNHS